jgi:hypothetical protein
LLLLLVVGEVVGEVVDAKISDPDADLDEDTNAEPEWRIGLLRFAAINTSRTMWQV